METIYINNKRFNYEKCKVISTGQTCIEVYLIHGIRYIEREFVGSFAGIKDLKEFVNNCMEDQD